MHKIFMTLILAGFGTGVTFSNAYAFSRKSDLANTSPAVSTTNGSAPVESGKFRDTTRPQDRAAEHFSSFSEATETPSAPNGVGLPGKSAGAWDSSIPTQRSQVQARANESKLRRSEFDCSATRKICETAESNCKALQSNKEINGEAIDYSLQYLVDNYKDKGLQDSSCAEASEKIHRKKRHESSGAPISKGLQTGKFVLNDFDSTLPSGRAQAYFVDLCGGEFREYSVKKGTGKGHKDEGGLYTTVLGSFMTSMHTRDFGAGKNQTRYRDAGLPHPIAVSLVGLNSSNTNTAWEKPFHESPTKWNTSSGCPSVDQVNEDIIKKMAGGSLLVNYKKGYMQTGKSCQNGIGTSPSDSAGAGAAKGGQ